MSEDPPLAHSAREGGSPQLYADHVVAVTAGAVSNAVAMLRFGPPGSEAIADVVETAAAAHDLGKLDEENQSALRKGRGVSLPHDHVDAGVACLMGEGDEAAAWLVRSHHSPGLPGRRDNFAGLGAPKLRGGRWQEANFEEGGKGTLVRDRTDEQLPRMVAAHERCIGPLRGCRRNRLDPLSMRLALSCLVDADHEDTARHDGFEPAPALAPRWDERIAALDAYVASLSSSGNAERDVNRAAFYEACKTAAPNGPIVACDGPVGIGKTTAVMAHLLRQAERDGLRRVIVVAPWTNVIEQSVQVLRRALVLAGEDGEAVVAEHHHRADFSDPAMRGLTATWRSPIVVTTAVQFFGTLAERHPGSLRKLHALPGSAVFLDEAHAALPATLWRQNWKWMNALAGDWRCRFVLASGSLARFWENCGVVDKPVRIPDLVGEGLRQRLLQAERRRVRYVSAGTGKTTIGSLCDRVEENAGPRLVILNTVHGAGVVAHELRDRGHETYHLSTALSPTDRAPIIETVRQRLAQSTVATDAGDWTLVATSCVEAGIDFSFRTAFRERWSAASLVQVGGRTNRNALWDEGVVHDIVMEDERVPSHPGADPASAVLGELLAANRFDDPALDPARLVTEAMADEVGRAGDVASACRCWRACDTCRCSDLAQAECKAAYPCVAVLGQPISDVTLMVVVNDDLRRKLQGYERPTFRELVRGTVRLWPYRVHALRLPEVRPGLYDWTASYDPSFLGIMQGVIERQTLQRDGGLLI